MLTDKDRMQKLPPLLCGLSIYKFSSILCKFLFRWPVTLKVPYFGEEFSVKTTILHLELLGRLKLKMSLKWPLFTAGGNKKWRSCCRNQSSSYSLNVCKQGYCVINSISKKVPQRTEGCRNIPYIHSYPRHTIPKRRNNLNIHQQRNRLIWSIQFIDL